MKHIALILTFIFLVLGCASNPTREQKKNVFFDSLFGEWIEIDRSYKKNVNVDTIKGKPVKLKLGASFLRLNKDKTYFEQTCSITNGEFELDTQKYILEKKYKYENRTIKVMYEILYLDNQYMVLSIENFTYCFKRNDLK